VTAIGSQTRNPEPAQIGAPRRPAGGLFERLRRLYRRRLLRPARRVYYLGWARYCNVCGSHLRKFLWGGVVVIRQEVRCPVCGSLERHRLAWCFFQRRTALFQGHPQRMLHVAPEPEFARRLARAPGLDYVTADLFDPAAMVQMDLMEIPFPDESFDAIYCSHVLEHVADDRRAMRELFRVLRTGGWAVLQVPITVAVTFEDPAITDPAERVKFFGQADHVRAYGPDYEDRLAAAGFQVTKVPGAEFLTPAEIDRLRIDTTESIFYCRKD